MEEYVIYGMALVGWGSLCFVVCKFMVWPFLKGLDEGLNGGVDEGEAYEAELQATLAGLQKQLDDQDRRTDGVEVQGNENTGGLRSLNERVVGLDKKFSEISHNQAVSIAGLQKSFDLHRESFERLLEVLGGTAKKKIITKGKSR